MSTKLNPKIIFGVSANNFIHCFSVRAISAQRWMPRINISPFPLLNSYSWCTDTTLAAKNGQCAWYRLANGVPCCLASLARVLWPSAGELVSFSPTGASAMIVYAGIVLFHFVWLMTNDEKPNMDILSYPILSYPILSYPILSYPILSYPILSYPILSYPILSFILSYYRPKPEEWALYKWPTMSQDPASSTVFFDILTY